MFDAILTFIKNELAATDWKIVLFLLVFIIILIAMAWFSVNSTGDEIITETKEKPVDYYQ